MTKENGAKVKALIKQDKEIRKNKKNIKLKIDCKYNKLVTKEKIITKNKKVEEKIDSKKENEKEEVDNLEKIENKQEKQEVVQEEKYLEIPTRWIKIKGWTKNLFEKWFMEEIDETELKAQKDKKQKKTSNKKSIFTRLKKAYNAFMEKEENDK
ncbi:MAG: hypothetical protein IJE68_04020 [Clostridia bacterium]|nr:hypothetical protein [Clostridia bacterium]